MADPKDRTSYETQDPMAPVPRYEFLNIIRDIDRIRTDGIAAKVGDELRVANLDKKVDDNIKDVNKRLEEKYMTKTQVADQFKIELSDYRFIKIILGVMGTGVIGLIFAVVQQYLINRGGA